MGSEAHSKFVIETDNLLDECENFAKSHVENLTESIEEAKFEFLFWVTPHSIQQILHLTSRKLMSEYQLVT